jgi:hypothetical protein
MWWKAPQWFYHPSSLCYHQYQVQLEQTYLSPTSNDLLHTC